MRRIYDALPEAKEVRHTLTEEGNAKTPTVSVIMGVFSQHDFGALEAAVESIRCANVRRNSSREIHKKML